MIRKELLTVLAALLIFPACSDGGGSATGGTAGSGGEGGSAGMGGMGGMGGGASLEDQVAAKLEAVRNDPVALAQLIDDMPKGADLHSHTSGAVRPESMIAWGSEDGACINTTTYVASAGPCAAGAVPIANANNDPALYDAIRTAWSMEGFQGTLLEDHQHFFDAFGKFGGVLTDARGDDMLAEVLSVAGKNEQVYIELMQGFGSSAVGKIGEMLMPAGSTWDEAYLLQKRMEIIADPGFATAIAAAKASIQSALDGSRGLLKCDTAMQDPGCDVDVRFMVAGTRTRSREYVFGQWVFGFELSQQMPEVVGVNLVSPEEDANSLSFYDDEMFAVDILHKFNAADPNRKPVHVGLHAGELIPEVLPMTPEGQSHLTFHIRNAVEKAHAERIGHGADVLGETAGDGSLDLMMDMAKAGVMVEICLTSNFDLLGATGDKHPLKQYLANNVPVALATDDQGILRIDASHEYQRAVEQQGLTYHELKKLARTSLEHGFMAGESLWKVRDDFTAKNEACAADDPTGMPSAACDAFLMTNDKARLQWKLEGRFMKYEVAAAMP